MKHNFPSPNFTLLDDDACIRAEIDMAAFLDDKLEDERQPRLFEHLMECDICLQALLECMAERDRPAARARFRLDRLDAAPADESRQVQEEPMLVRMPRGPQIGH